MDIYILREGRETGPHSEETARMLLDQGDVSGGDFAWHAGLSDWLPLGDVLAAAPAATEAPAVSERVPAAEKSGPATPKQKALLSYLGIAQPVDLSRDQAALLVNDVLEDPNNTGRLTQWNEERLRLHPELFAAEIQAKKENRAAHFLELCHTTGADYFSGITKAHCQVLVGFLDVTFPHWDAREADAAEHYFFPAVAEKFPQLVQKQWRGRLQYADGPKVAPDIARKSPTSRLRRSGTSPLVAVTRGVLLGLVILAGLYLAHRTMQSSTTAAPPASLPTEPARDTPLVHAPAPAALVVAAMAPQDLPPIEPLPPPTQTEPPFPAPPPPSTVPDPGITPSTVAATPPVPMAPVETAPPMAAPDSTMAPMAGMASALTSAPMASLPGAEPPVPLPAPPATMPTPATLPGLPPEAAAIPPLTPVELPPGLPPMPLAKTNLLLTKAVEVQLAYGKIILPPGTPVKLVSRQGEALKVSYQNTLMTVPASSTDAE